ncbi:MlaD family protein [Mucilaginibacter sp. OK283]|uniref:MlaD family protein n=1 Tax=Mucilaginibacter sp. OK283 TaxID=1881049 RepID=UPI0008D56974|nr:MlaD family protein [Mucilaginibacter sp. OK283]SEP41614.1 phospholipid/cholesterol/gamma-HCH transport system substrate-binding protein [Mucilaginibacter sp. OK283]
MVNEGENNTKLGVFTLAGLLALIFSFYMIGKNHNLFGGGIEIKARFSNLNGLIAGNNVLYAGIQAGTVKDMQLLNDTLIEVILLIDPKVGAFIHKNAIASIGTEGLMGNKVINIQPGTGGDLAINKGDYLQTRKAVNTDAMLQTLDKTNNNIALISEELKSTVGRINESKIFEVLNDKDLGSELRSSLSNVHQATAYARDMATNLDIIVKGIKKGRGAAGLLLTDTAFAGNLNNTMQKIRLVSDNANQATIRLNTLIEGVKQDLSSKDGSLSVLLRDSVLAGQLKQTMKNIQDGTAGFNQNMEALKHNFLLRGYFKNLEKNKKKDQF